MNQKKKPNTSTSSKEEQWLLEEKYGGVSTPAYEEDKKRLARGEPLAYVIGFSDFLGAHIALDSRPLIPRPETAFWAEHVISQYKERFGNTPFTALDLFAGSGCIGIALLTHLPNATVHFAEKESAHCRQIQENLTRNDIAPSRVQIFQTDIWKGIPDTLYDVICANPPYVAEGRPVQDSVKTWESETSVYAPEDGLFYIRETIRSAQAHLTEGGMLYIEFDPPQKDEITHAAEEAGFSHISFWHDQYGEPRMVTLGGR